MDNGVEKKEEPALNAEIIRQIEYYFGDINLPRDKFLQEQVKLEDGWVPLDVMLKFKRLASLTTDGDVIVTALGESDLMEVSEDKKKIRRDPNCPLPILNEERRKELMTRTVYCKGFPVESTTLDNLLTYFKPHGAIDNVQMRTYKDKEANKFVFKGSVFVIFKTRDLASKFLAEENIKYEDTELIRKWQSDYVDDKRKERSEKKKSTKKPDVKEEEPKEELPKGAILHIKGIGDDTTRDNIREKLLNQGLDVAFIDFNKGDNEAWVRLLGENSSKQYVEKLENGKLEINDTEVELRCLEGEEETTFLEKTKIEMEKRRQMNSRNNKRGRRGGRGGGRGGGGRGGRGGFLGKRRGSPVRGGPRKKEVKEEESDGVGDSD